MRETPIFIVDAFVGQWNQRQLRGNPAAVVLLESPREDAWMQEVAAEMNLSETAFVRHKDAQNFELRWFTPSVEVALCGHATLAAAHVLWEIVRIPHHQTIHFETLSGVLSARWQGERIALDFAAQEAALCAWPDDLGAALDLSKDDLRTLWRVGEDFLIELSHETLVEHLCPDFALLHRISSVTGIRGFIVTANAEWPAALGGFDFVSRFFAPAIGIDEDPVTGSAHAALAPFWCARLDKTELVGYQASKRGGFVKVKCQNGLVELSGLARTRLRGVLPA